jgi:hypothetical protein
VLSGAPIDLNDTCCRRSHQSTFLTFLSLASSPSCPNIVRLTKGCTRARSLHQLCWLLARISTHRGSCFWIAAQCYLARRFGSDLCKSGHLPYLEALPNSPHAPGENFDCSTRGGNPIFPTFVESLSQKTVRRLEKLCVKVLTGTMVEKVDCRRGKHQRLGRPRPLVFRP